MRVSLGLAALFLGLALALAPAAAAAGSPPAISAAWVTEVNATSASFHAEVDPEGSATDYLFEYITDQAYRANLAAGHDAFAGAAKTPLAELEGEPAFQHLSVLKSATIYHYRVTATNEAGTTTGATPPNLEQLFTTQAISGSFALPDNRAWELVSPPDKNGGAIQAPGQNHSGGIFQAASSGLGAITYASASSFGGSEAQGAPLASQYISRRTAGGWSTENITTPVVSGSYGNDPNGVPYQLFSPDLSTALLLNGVHCRGEGTGCPVANPPLPGTEAPAGYQNYYLRDDESAAFQALLTEANGQLALTPSQFNLAFAGASPDLRHVVLSTCAALTSTAIEVPGPEGCQLAETNLYEWSGGGLTLVNLLPGESHGTPGAGLAAESAGAVSADGSRVYLTDQGKLYLREGATTELVSPDADFQAATPDGSRAFYLAPCPAGTCLFLFEPGRVQPAIETPASAVLGISDDGHRAYYVGPGGHLYLWQDYASTEIAAAAQASDYPPTTGTARVSADGSRLLFLSKAQLTGYDNTDADTGQPDSEVFLYEAASGGARNLLCVSCNPTGERPLGPSTIPGATANGLAAGSTEVYKPRDLSNTDRVFFDSSDALVPLDTNQASDAYQWEAQGVGTCAKPAGCIGLISSGTDSQGASFIDASESGEDAYFRTFSSLEEPPNLPHVTVAPAGDVDPGSADLYDARVGGGFPEPPAPIPCEGDACQPLPGSPEDPTVGSLIPGPGNPPVHFPPVPCKKGTVRKAGKCVKKPSHHKKRHAKAKRRQGGQR